MSASVVPARAGMSPKCLDRHPPALGGPRASGDEPEYGVAHYATGGWSPRERG